MGNKADKVVSLSDDRAVSIPSYLSTGKFVPPVPCYSTTYTFEISPGKTIQVPGDFSELITAMEPETSFIFPNISSFTEEEVYEGVNSIYLLVDLKNFLSNGLTKLYNEKFLSKPHKAKEWITTNLSMYREIVPSNPFLIWWSIPFTEEMKFINTVFEMPIINDIYTSNMIKIRETYDYLILSNNYMCLKLLYAIHNPLNGGSVVMREYLFQDSLRMCINIPTLEWMIQVNSKSSINDNMDLVVPCKYLAFRGNLTHLEWCFNRYVSILHYQEEHEDQTTKILLECYIHAPLENEDIIDWVLSKNPIFQEIDFLKVLLEGKLPRVIRAYDYFKTNNLPINYINCYGSLFRYKPDIADWIRSHPDFVID
jgi:hypothetical protein